MLGEAAMSCIVRRSARNGSWGCSFRLHRSFSSSASLTVGHLGKAGSFSHGAAMSMSRYFECGKWEYVQHPTLTAVLDAVQRKEIHLGIVPIESSSGGTFMHSHDLLVRSGLHIAAEMSRVEDVCVAALPGTDVSSIRTVVSHPDILKQCSQFLFHLESKLPEGTLLEQVAKNDSSASCEWLAIDKQAHAAVICSRQAAEISGLSVLETNVGNDTNLQTRYLVVSNGDVRLTTHEEGVAMKGCMIIKTPDSPGALKRVLEQFASRDVNIKNIIVRPLIGFLETSANGLSSNHGAALTAGVDQEHFSEFLFTLEYTVNPKKEAQLQASVEEFTAFCRNLGTYPSFLARRSYKAPSFDKDMLSVIHRG